MPPQCRRRGGNRALTGRFTPRARERGWEELHDACKDYQEKTWVGVSSTITESDSPSAASRGYCGYFA